MAILTLSRRPFYQGNWLRPACSCLCLLFYSDPLGCRTAERVVEDTSQSPQARVLAAREATAGQGESALYFGHLPGTVQLLPVIALLCLVS